MAFTRVRGSGITTTDNYIVGVITATKFVGESGGSATFDNVSIGGSLTVNGDFTTLNTTLREVELLQVDANSSTAAGIITQRGSGDILNLFDGTTEVFTVKDGGNFGVGTINPLTKAVISNAGAEGLEVHHASGTVEVNAYNRSGGGSRSPFEITAQTFKLSTGNPGLSAGLHQNASGYLSIGSDNVTDVNLLTLNGSGASKNIGIVFNKTNSPARAHGIQVSNTTGDLVFYDYTASAEALRITTDGHLLLGGTADVNDLTTSAGQKGLVIGSTGMGNAGLAIINSTTGAGRIYFGDNTGSHADRKRGQICYYHNDGSNSDYMTFVTAGAEALRITSLGTVNVNGNFTQTTYPFSITTGNVNKKISFGAAAHGSLSNEGSGIFFSRQNDGSAELSGLFSHSNGGFGIATREDMTFHTGGGSTYGSAVERIRITSGGLVGIGTVTPESGQLQVIGNGYHQINISANKTANANKL